MRIEGNIVDLFEMRVFSGALTVENGVIVSVSEAGEERPGGQYLIPGFVDSHIHIESSMLTPVEFSRVALGHGTIATVSDAHEIANVSGIAGIEFMIENASHSPLKFHFSAPSCVPFDSGSPFTVSAADAEKLMMIKRVNHLGEVMNVHGVLAGEKSLMDKIAAAKNLGMAVDGHAPGLSGEDLEKYAAAGITTDHECVAIGEALEKIGRGMKIQIREGSAAKDFEALFPLLNTHHGSCMFCSDDRHPEDLLAGHINLLVKKAVARGVAPLKALAAASLNPIVHYKLDCGLLREGDPADFLVVDNLCDFNVLKTFVDGRAVFDSGMALVDSRPASFDYSFNATPKKPSDFAIFAAGAEANVIEAADGSLVTKKGVYRVRAVDGMAVADPENDVVKIALISRYRDAPPVMGFIRNTGLKRGAIASSVNHDAHNIIAAGSDDESLARAVNLVIGARGGISAVAASGESDLLPLPIAGIISDMPCEFVERKYAGLEKFVSEKIGVSLTAPFMTLSFMSLFVIPSLKMSSAGLFDADAFRRVGLFER